MRICILSRGFDGLPGPGISTFTYYCSRSLVRLGHEVHIITDHISASSRAENSNIWIHNLQTNVFSLNEHRISVVSGRISYGISISRSVPRIVKDYRIDVVESPDWYAESIFLCCRKHTPPLVLRCHTPLSLLLIHSGYKNLFAKLAGYLEGIPIVKASSVISTSKALARYLLSRYNRQPNYIIYNGINLSMLKNLCSRAFRERWHIGQYPMILCIGTKGRNKGLHLPLRILNTILKMDRHVRIVFTGILPLGSLPTWYHFIKPSYRERVIFTGWLPYGDFVSAVAECDIAIQPSLWESCSYATLEAMALGKAIVASRVGGLPEIIIDGESGLLFDLGDSAALLRNINILLTDCSYREKLGRNAQLRAMSLFNDEVMAKRSVLAYRKLLDMSCS